MWAHWGFKSPAAHLEQGDILRPTQEIVDLLTKYHPHYANHKDNRFYIVLTQSCDLVQRAGACKARYIAIAPVRTIDAVVEREFVSGLSRLDDGTKFAPARIKSDLQKFLQRVINNNEPGYFYIEVEPAAGISGPMCATLALPISFRAEHYQKFKSARVISLEDSFQAKLGWLLGQMYSRVGTRDFTDSEVNKRVNEIVPDIIVWLDPRNYEHLGKTLEAERAEHAEKKFSIADIERISQTLPKRKEQAIEAILGVATAAGLLQDGRSPERRRFRQGLQSSSEFSQYFSG